MKLGETIQGGVYIGENIIVPLYKYEHTVSTYYGCYEIETGANSETDGYENTQKLILAAYGCKSENMPEAALYCNSLIIGGHNDWYLPSKYELEYMFQMRQYFSHYPAWYFSSSEDNGTFAWALNFSNGYSSRVRKVGYRRYASPIRKFDQ